MGEASYDVIVLGGGAGGVPASIRASQLGGRVAIVESDQLGGLCMNRGCVPFGHMMAASDILGSLALGKEMGLGFGEVKSDFSALMKRQNELISFMRQGVKSQLNKKKVEILQGKGKIIGKGQLEVNGKTYSYKKLILATGAKWVKPDFPGSDAEGVITTDELLAQEKLPKKILLYGNNPHLISIAQFLNRYGSAVTLAVQEKDLLAAESKVIRSRLAAALRNQGITVWTGVEMGGVKRQKDGLHCSLKVKDRQEALVVESVLSPRRGAALTGLGLESVGYNKPGDYIAVNNLMETGLDGIYAIGDVSAPESKHYSHQSSNGGIVAAENAMGLKSTYDSKKLCRVLFTRPQVACVGLTGKEAKEAGYDVVEGAAPLSMNPLGMILTQTEGIVEVVAEKRYGEVLGIHFIGEGASEMAGVGVLALQMEATLEDLARAVFPHPTLNESLADAARECLGRSIFLP
ncbi:MAG: dihydrolipoyl dehydrogenase family protein [Deltaproteobacteria bacterium]